MANEIELESGVVNAIPVRAGAAKFIPKLPELEKYDKYLYGFIGLASFIFLWWLANSIGLLNPKFLSPPRTVLVTLISGLLPGGDLWPQIWPSLRRGLEGFAIALVVGIAAGIAAGSFSVVEKTLAPVLLFFRNLSILALFPVFLLFFGIGEQSKVAIVAWASFWPIFVNTTSAVKGVERILINAARTLGAGKAYIFAYVVLPAAFPNIFPGIRLAASYAFTALVAAEYLGATEGLGIYIRASQERFEIAEMYSGIVVLGLIGVIVNAVLTLVERRVTSWQLGITNR
ncbi:ABC transporter permease [Xanthobacter sp. V4C-4]|uniref:ABC transporter permease n=1 Tax=Xanthobacter cornucopiae TaxID=3119924 RepID=UPI0037299D2A